MTQGFHFRILNALGTRVLVFWTPTSNMVPKESHMYKCKVSKELN